MCFFFLPVRAADYFQDLIEVHEESREMPQKNKKKRKKRKEKKEVTVAKIEPPPRNPQLLRAAFKRGPSPGCVYTNLWIIGSMDFFAG